jgi:hypothetical protein
MLRPRHNQSRRVHSAKRSEHRAFRIRHLVRQFPHDAPLPTDLARRRLCRRSVRKLNRLGAAITLTGCIKLRTALPIVLGILSSPQSCWIWSTPHLSDLSLRFEGSLLFDRRQRPRLMRARSGSKGIQGVSHQNANAQYNYHCRDGLKHKRPPEIVLSN